LTQRHQNSFIRAIGCTQFKSGSAYIYKAVKSVISQHKRAKKSCGLAKNESGTAYIDKAVKSVITQHKNSFIRAIRCTQFKSGAAYIDKAVKSVITQHKQFITQHKNWRK